MGLFKRPIKQPKRPKSGSSASTLAAVRAEAKRRLVLENMSRVEQLALLARLDRINAKRRKEGKRPVGLRFVLRLGQ
jgi:hypothetical protein